MQNKLYKRTPVIFFLLALWLNVNGQTTYTSTDIPVAISSSGTSTITSTIDISTNNECIDDIDVSNLDISHTSVNDLIVTLTSPAGTTITLLDQVCSNENNVDIEFNDSGSSYASIPCPPDDGNDYQPFEALSAFDGESIQGTWILSLTDSLDGNGGTLNGWSLDITTSPCTAPSGACDANTPFQYADMTSSSTALWISENIRREDLCCGIASGAPPARCIEIEIALNSQSMAFEFGIYSGSQPSGSMYFQVDCGPQVPVGDSHCVSGAGPFTLTFCKPGNSANEYYIQAIPAPDPIADINVIVNCEADANVIGLQASTAVWNDITSGTGAYNSFLSCTTGCLDPVFLAPIGSPPFIDYEVCGTSDNALCANTTIVVCDTVRVNIYPPFTITITPNPAQICNAQVNTTPLIATTDFPGQPYDYTWYDGFNATGSVVGDTSSFIPQSAGNYSVYIYNTAFGVCSEQIENVVVTESTLPVLSAVPADVTVDCNSIPAAAILTATDYNSNALTVNYTEVIGAGCPYIITRTWSATDDCNNTVTGTQTIQVEDTTAPVLQDIPADVVLECADCIQSFENGDFEENSFLTNWAYIDEDNVPGWSTTSSDDLIEIHKSGQMDGIVSFSGNYHAELNATQNGDFYQEFCVIPSTTLIITFAHHKRMVFFNTSDDIMGVYAGPDQGSLTLLGTYTATDASGWTQYTVVYPVPAGQTNGVFLFRAIQGSPFSAFFGNLIDDITVTTLFQTTDPSVTDDCDNNVAIITSEVVIPGACANQMQITRTWTATDNCGNTVSDSQTITVGDFVAPTLIGVPADVIVECDNIPVAPVVIATDNCNTNLTVNYNEVIGAGCPYVITRTWDVTDDCGNATTEIQTINVIDTTDPVLVGVPANITVECDAIPIAPVVTATDNCSVGMTVNLTETIGAGCPYTITRTWDVTDDCGNTATATQIITVDDTTPPVILNVPSDATVLCSAIPAPPVLTAADNCFGGLITVNFTEVIGTDCPNTITRTWEATDNCGNQSTATQILTVIDEGTPVFPNVPADITIACITDLPPMVDLTWTDDCDGTGTVTGIDTTNFIQVISSGGSTISSSTYTSEALDSGSYIIDMGVVPQTINNGLKPFGLIYDLVRNNLVPIKWVIEPSKSKDGIDFSHNGKDYRGGPFIIPAAYITATVQAVINSWELQGVVGDKTVGPITVSVYKTIDYIPTWALDLDNGNIAERFLQDAGIPNSAYEFALPTELDSCHVIFVLPHADPNWGSHENLYTWNKPKALGGSAGSVWIGCHSGSSVENSTNPVDPTKRMNFLMSDPIAPETDPAVPFGSHDDGSPPYQYAYHDHPIMQFMGTIDEATENGSEQVFLPTNTWRASTKLAVWDDTQSDIPGLSSGPAGVLVFGQPYGDPDRGLVCYTGGHNIRGNDPDNIAAMRSFFNFSFYASGIEAIALDLTVPTVVSAGSTNTLSASTTGGVGVINFQWSSDCTGTFSDPTVASPTFTPDPSATDYICNISCIVSDECGLRTTFLSFELLVLGNNNVDCYDDIIRYWTYTDACGNTGSVTQSIVINDSIAPVSNIPADITVSCENVVLDSSSCCDPNGLGLVYDGFSGGTDQIWPTSCPDATASIAPAVNSGAFGTSYRGVETQNSYRMTFDVPVSFVNLSMLSVHRNSEIGDFRLVLQDGTIINNADFTLSYAAADDDFGLLAQEAGGGNSFINRFNKLMGAPFAAGVHYVDNDQSTSGGSRQAWGILKFDDPQYLTNPITDLSYSINSATSGGSHHVGVFASPICSPTVISPAPSVNAFSDNCDTNPTTSSTDILNGSGCNYTITRTYEGTDECGNTTTGIQTINVEDTIDPVLAGVPVNLTVDCNAIPVVPVVTATDNCSTNLSVNYNEVIGSGCPYIITRSWSSTDDCGNTATQTQTITVEDTTDPVLQGVPADVVIDCADCIQSFENSDFEENILPGSWALIHEDNIAGWSTTSSNDLIEIQKSGQINGVVSFSGNYHAELNGNTVGDFYQEFCVIPTTTLMITFAHHKRMAGLNTSDDIMGVYAGSDLSNLTLIGTYTATSSSGWTQHTVVYPIPAGQANAVFLFRAIQGAPSNNTYGNLIDDINVVTLMTTAPPTVTDDCDNDIEVITDQVTINGACPNQFQVIRTWTATDDCGNSVMDSQTVTIGDFVAPTLAGVPADVTVECDAIPSVPTVTATDNCDANLTVNYNEIIGAGCNYSITRTWDVADECGNTTTETQIITVEDTTDPVLVSVPSNATVECDAVPAAPVVTATDNCSVNLTVNFTETTGGACPSTTTRTWSVTDDCGNTTTAIQTIIVDDTTDPVLIGVPADETVQCDAIPSAPVVTATDNCSAGLTVNYNEVIGGGCPYVITRTWDVTDDCGNTITENQRIQVIDSTFPSLTGVPADITVQCNAIPVAVVVTSADNCTTNPMTVNYNEVIGGGCPYVITRTWDVTDDCGNTTTETQTIDVIDTTDPVLVGVPADITIECDAIPAAAVVTATDNCTTPLTVNYNEVIGGGCPYVITRTWDVSDDCGNTTTATQIIQVIDTTDPVLVGVPADAIVECDAVPVAANVTATDNCTTPLTVNYNEVIGNGCPYVITRTWDVTDDCGNTTTQTQTINVIDTTDPVLVGVPADITVECDAIPVAAVVTSTDNCTTPLTVNYNEVIGGGCPYVITRTWDVTDDCGNTVTATQTINVIDTTDPVLVGVPADATIECDAIPVAAVVTATDNCTTPLTVNYTEVIGNGCPYVITRTWDVTDDCGNTTTATQTIQVIDTTDPVLVGVPSDATVECDAVPVAPVVTATDNCSINLTVNSSEVIGNGCPYVITRTWDVTDDCGNTTTATQTINVIDTTDPVLVGVPADATVECDAIPVAAVVTVTDNCAVGMTVNYNEVIGNGCPYVITRTWDVTDDCGNTTTATQTINVIDTTDPVLVGVPADVTVQCNAIPAAAVVTATDNCTTPLTVNFNEVLGAGCPYTITRTWDVTDDCGNTATTSQVINVIDNVDPVLVGVPADITVQCDAIPVAAVVTATDNCTTPLTVNYNEVIGNGCPYTITRTWDVSDNCGNTTTETQTISVQDNIAPVLQDVPVDITLACADCINSFENESFEENPFLGSFSFIDEDNINGWNTSSANNLIEIQKSGQINGVASFSGNYHAELNGITDGDLYQEFCVIPSTTLMITFAHHKRMSNSNTDDDIMEVHAGANPGSLTLLGTYTATSTSGWRQHTVVYTIPAGQTTGVFLFRAVQGVPGNITYGNLIDDITVVTLQSATVPSVTDNCDNNIEVIVDQVVTPGACVNQLQLVRTWTATDDCGNIVTESQTVTVSDLVAPTLAGVPADITVECDNIPIAPVVTATDNCSTNLTVNYNEVIGGGCPYVITRTWDVADECGNTTTETQTINVIDTTDPVLVGVPADAIVECDAVPVAANVTATDNCTTPLTVNYNEVIGNGCPYVITRTWDVTDDCGNTTTATQTIQVIDTTDPVLVGVPADATVECDAIPAAAVVTATDNCSINLTVNYNEVIGNGCPYVITRTWDVTDDCGNTTSQTQTIDVIDTTDPILVGVPADAIVECDAIPVAAVVTATDNCAVGMTVNYNEVIGGGCPYVITRTWDVTDDCGNTTTQTQTIDVIDTTDPILVGVPADITVECDAIPVAAVVTATDNCTTPLTVNYNEVIGGGCPYVITRTWDVSDDCGNTTTQTQTINVIDTTDPVLVGVPADITVECDAIPVAAVVTATDNCTTPLTVNYNEVIGGGCPYVITRTWDVTDDCGNTTTQTQTINVIDTTDPVLVGVPADATVECDAIPVAANVIAADNCSTNLTVNYNEVIGNGCPYVITRTWDVTDDCGNTTTETQTIQVIDTTDPVLVGVPSDATVECDAVPVAANVTATDNCTTPLTVNYNEVIGNGCPYVITRTWDVTDDCGNTTTSTQTIQVIDTTDPVLVGVPADATVECDAIPAAAVVTATDNCSINLTVNYNEVIGNGCPYVITRTWDVTDDCGNTTTQTQTIDVIDTTDPVLVGVPADITVECDAIPAAVVVTATDNCAVGMTVNYNEVIGGGCPYVITRTWDVTDDCGNTTTQTQTINVIDTTDPVLVGVPADITVECDAIPVAAVVTATDNCTTPLTVNYNEVIGGGCPYVITRTWDVSDDCGNTTTQTQTINVIDTTDPVLVGVPADITVECDAIPVAAVVTATDNCTTPLTVNYNEVIGGGCPYVITRTWDVTDDCGNTTTQTQTINVIDTTDPVLVGVPADATVECDAIPVAANVIAADNCSTNLTVNYNEVIGNGCPYVITRTWDVTDDCGNTTTETQTIQVIDTTDPVLVGVPADAIVECDAVPVAANVTATDNCTTPLTVNYNEVIGNGCPYVITRTWDVTDDCGNTTTATQTIQVIDTTDPILVGVPADATVECDAIPAAAVVTATDNCSINLTVNYNEVIGNGCPYVITRTWDVTDDCGNTTTQTQTIDVIDTTDPVLVGMPVDITVECDAIPAAVVVTATDNCAVGMTVNYNEVIGGGCPYVITRTWDVTDDCGNTTTQTQTINVIDTTDPVLVGVPVDITVECDAIPVAAVVTATDNCTTPLTVNYNEVIGGGCPYVITRTWDVSDDCGNTTTQTQTINVIDTTDPVLVGVPADITVECDAIPVAAVVTATDNCTTPLTVNYNEVIGGGCPYVITRTWDVTDDCGNTTTQTQTINVIDTTDPVLVGVPSDATVECDAVPVAANVIAADNCSTNLTVNYNEVIGNGCPYVITRTWDVTDDCGNTTTETQTIQVIDTTDPVLVGVPSDATVECDAVPVAANVTATDNCTTPLTVNYNEVIGNGCPYVITRTWDVTDDCGNTTTATQTIQVIDTTDPVLVGVPADATVECDAIPAAAVVTATDNCTTPLTVNYNEVIGGGCPYVITRTWDVTDDCGNTTTQTQTINVIDTTDPVLVGMPVDITVECDAIPAATVVTATDNCAVGMTVNYNEVIGGGCPYVITRTWDVTDDCGNTTTQTQTIDVIDTTDPILVGVPADITVECDAIPVAAVVTATDNCTTPLTVNYNEVIGGGCPYVITRTWDVSDDCGNTTTQTQTINVIDTTDPVLVGVPADITVECDAIPVAAVVTATDNCTTPLTVNYNEVIGGGCPYVITRTWDVTDDCGNTTTQTQTINVIDTTDPVLVGVPADATVECDAIPVAALVTATDNCTTPLTVNYNEVIGGGCPYVITRTWDVTDDCGNTTTQTQTIQVIDTTDPVLVGVPADAIVECDAIPVAAVVTSTDNCSVNMTVNYNEVVVGGCPYVLTRTWDVTDDCGNTTTATQTIQVIDTTDPVLVGVPADITIECDAIPVAAVVTATDNCAIGMTVNYIEVIGNGCPYFITRTWDVTDDCGNTTMQTQTINVIDTTDPVLVGVPADITVECDAIPIAAVVTATDNCAVGMTVNYNEVIGTWCPYFIIRTWDVTDDCGNTTTATQTINVIDTTDPVLVGIPADITVECDAIPIAAVVTSTDNCTTPLSVNYNEVIGGGCSHIITRTWNVSDDCGNTTTATQTINVIDTTDPILVGVPADVTVECDAVPTVSVVTATDNCSSNLTVNYNEVVGVGCPYLITRTWDVTDDCGNTTAVTQTINIIDTTYPVLSAAPVDLTVNCDSIPSSDVLTATDNCNNVIVTFTEVVTPGACMDQYFIERTWTTVDACGNSTTHIQNIAVIDCGPDLQLEISPSSAVCENRKVIISVNLTAGYTTPYYQWQFSGDNGLTWTDLPGANSASHSFHVTPPDAALYRVLVSNNPADIYNPDCSEIATPIDVTILYHTPVTELVEEICEGDSFQFGTNFYSSSGIYTDTFVSYNGCDSTVNLDLTVHPIVYTNLAETICEGDTVFVGSSIYTLTGNYTDILTSVITNCDSIVNLDLFVIPTKRVSKDIVLCSGDSYNSISYTADAILKDTFSALTGCDSIFTANILVNPTYIHFNTQQLCEGEPYAGVFYTTDTSFVENLLTINGCDSIVNTQLNVTPIIQITIDVDLCFNGEYEGNNYTQSTTIQTVYTSANNCDSVVTANITVHDEIIYNLSEQICEGDSSELGGIYYTDAGIYSATFASAFGCDSTVILNLFVIATYTSTITADICDGEIYTINGINQTTSGSYYDTLINNNGCPAILITNLTVHPVYQNTVYLSICQGSSIYAGGANQTESGIYTDNYPTASNQCDSIIITELTVLPSMQTSISEEICQGDSYYAGGAFQTESGVYIDSFTVSGFCDSIVITTLLVFEVEEIDVPYAMCEGDSILVDGVYYTEAGSYHETFTSQITNCDSMVNYLVEILDQPETYAEEIICEGESVFLGGAFQQEEGEYIDIYTAASGCDSIVTTMLFVEQSTELTSEDQDICFGEDVQLLIEGSNNVRWYPEDGLSCVDCIDPVASPLETTTYTVSAESCLGTTTEIQVTVTVNHPPSLTLTQSASVLNSEETTLKAVSSDPNALITWYANGEVVCEDCSRMTADPSLSLSYQVTVENEFGCINSDEIYLEIEDGCSYSYFEVPNIISPNGDGSNDYFKIKYEGVSGITILRIYNRWGEMVFETRNIETLWDGTFRGEELNPGVYVYYFEGHCLDNTPFTKTGNITLLK